LQIDIRTVFYLAIMPGLLAFVMIMLVKERVAAVPSKSKLDRGVRQFPTDYWRYLLVIALFGLGNSSNAFLILRVQDVGASLKTTILVYASFNLVAAVISYPAGSLSDGLGRRNVLFASFLIFATAYLGLAVTQDTLFVAMLFVLYGLHQGILRAVGKALASDLVPEHLRASGLGWYSATLGSSQLVASIVAGVLWDRIGHEALFYYATAFAIVASIGLILLLPARHAPVRLATDQAN
jgi:MFS family permease